ncbi:conserved hypothetical protein [Frankia canadensis]|uniref:Uncharacterized protein n=1 Tax=Frankia canadensis TaxID=1836972 RepID=A0A2I2L1X0_9ACTN|nr:hypothetical protein [Frankia canadensis]SNQ51912.1 conserved hypothetical protein [Frankia canadensis]SOU59202.1 conserved hypothetical protein [Frankia canadensis]
MTDSGESRLGDGSGDARIVLHRLLDAAPVRHLLDDSNPRATLVAAILSGRVFEDVVAGGYSTLDPDYFVPVDVEEKRYRGQAYLYVPRPSGGLLNHGFRLPDAPPGQEGTGTISWDSPPPASRRSAVQAGTAAGGPVSIRTTHPRPACGGVGSAARSAVRAGRRSTTCSSRTRPAGGPHCSSPPPCCPARTATPCSTPNSVSPRSAASPNRREACWPLPATTCACVS